MERKDLWKVYSYAVTIWPNFHVPNVEPDRTVFDEVWFECLKMYDFDLVLFSIKEYAKTNDFCNVAKLADLCDKHLQIMNGTYVYEDDLIQEIRKAICAPSKEDSFEKLSAPAKEVVGGVWQLYKWGMMATGEVESVVMSHIRKGVHNVQEKRKFERTLQQLGTFDASKIKQIKE